MANKKISDLPLAVAMAGTELFEIDQANVSKRISAVGLFTTVLPILGVPSPTSDFVVPVRQSSTGAAWGVTISALMQALHGLPAGGTTGQLLVKQSNSDYDTAWANAGTVFSVGLSMPSIFTVSNSPVTSSGTLTAVLNTQTANLVFAGPGSGGAVSPTFRLLVGADLPNPSAASLGGVQSAAAVSHQWINSISTAGVPALSQPAFADISGTALVTQGGTGLTAGTSGGIAYFSAATTMASSGVLAASALVLGGGAGAAPTALGSLGATTTVLHGNAAGAPTFGAVVLTTDVSGVLPVANGGTGGTLPVANGGTGQVTLTNHGVLVGAGTSAITQLAAAAAGTLLTGQGTGSDPAFSATPTLGVAGTTLGSLSVAGSASGVVTIQPQAAAGTFNFNLPVAAGTAGQPLLSGGGAAAPQTYGTLGVAAGGTALVSGTSGGVLGYTATGVLASSVLLTANALMLGGGAGATPTPLASLGTTTTVLHGNAGGAPSFGAVVLTTDVSGTLPVGNGGSGAATFTANGVLLGNGVSPLGVTAVGATGTILAGNTAAAPTFQTLSAIIDAATGTTTQGSVLFRGASGWAALSPSSAGRVLTTNGAGLDVSWSAVSGTGTVTSITAGAGLTGGTITTTGAIALSTIPTGNVLGNFSGAAAVPTAQAARQVLTSNLTIFVGANLGACTITIASPAVVGLTAHGLLANDPVVFQAPLNRKACTVSAASPGIVSLANSFAAGQPVSFDSTGTLPAGLAQNTTYYVIAAGLTGSQFEVSATVGGSAINTTALANTFVNGNATVTASAAHNFVVGQIFQFAGTSVVGVSNATNYYVLTTPSGTTFTFSATSGGTAVTPGAVTTQGTIAQTGSHFCSTAGSLPTGITTGTVYYVISAGLTANSFEVSTTPGGAAVNTSGSVTGSPIYTARTGNDSNNGLAATRAGALLTPAKAMSVVANTLDTAGFALTIQFADGAYADVPFVALPYAGGGTIALVGNITIPENVNFSVSSSVNGIFNFSYVGGNWAVHGFKLSSSLGSGNGNGLLAQGNLGLVTFGNMNFGALAAGFHISTLYGGHIENDAAYTISGGAANHLFSADTSILHTTASATITITGTPAFSTAFMTSHGSGGIIGTVEGNYSGAITGTSASADDFGLIDIANPALLPGSGMAPLFSGGMIAGVSANPTFGGAAFGGAGTATFANGTSGKIIVTAPSGALGTQTQTLPIASGTYVLSGRTTYGDVSTTLLPTDGPFIQLVNGLTVARTWTLPLSNSLPAGTLLIISDAGGIGGANTLTIQRQGANTFNGIGVAGNAITMSTAFGTISVRNDGAGGWYLVAKT